MLCVVVGWRCLLRVASMVDVCCFMLLVVEYVWLNGVVCCVLCGIVRVLLSVVSACCWLFDVGVVACCCVLLGVCCVSFVVRYRLIAWFELSMCAVR